MKLREKMKESYESMNCCKAVSFLDGKIVAVLHEGRIESIVIDGRERTITPELIHCPWFDVCAVMEEIDE